MRSFRLEKGRSFRLPRAVIPTGVFAVLAAAVCSWWQIRIAHIDLGNNDFAGAFYLLVAGVLYLLAIRWSVWAFVQTLTDFDDSHTLFWRVNAAGGCIAAIVVTSTFVWATWFA